MGESARSVNVGGRALRVTSPDRVVYPEDGITKAAVIGYYVHMAERMLPHLRRLPVVGAAGRQLESHLSAAVISRTAGVDDAGAAPHDVGRRAR